MWSRLLSALLSTLLWSAQGFFVPLSLTGRGEVRCSSQHQQQQQASAHSKRTTIATGTTTTTTAAAASKQDRRATDTAVLMSSSGDGSCDREAFLSEIARVAVAGVGITAAGALAPKMATAKEEIDVPVDWKAEFGSVKKATDLVMSDLRNLANSGDWEELMAQAKAYDQSIRKGLMGNVRKKMPKEVKADAMTYRNNITFDLIAINKAARVEDKPQALEVLDVLESDINAFLNLEKRI